MGLSAEQQAWQDISGSPLEILSRSSEAVNPWSQWINAVCQLSIGDYRKALTVLKALVPVEPVEGDVEKSKLSEIEGLASAAIASGLRQLGEHGQALHYDSLACAGTGSAQVDGRIGLAADFVGLGQSVRAATALAEARQALDGWRDRVRYHWVNAEIALLTDETRTAISYAEAATEDAVDSPRHLAKSLLFLGVAKNTYEKLLGDEQLIESVGISDSLQLRPLLWPAVRVLEDRADPAQIAKANEALSFIADRIPSGLGSHWEGLDVVRRG